MSFPIHTQPTLPAARAQADAPGVRVAVTGSSFEAAAAMISVVISQLDFSFRERRILEIIRQASFCRGETEAYIPGLKYFVEIGRMTKGHVSTLLNHLKRSHVIEEEPKDFYGFKLPVDQWKVPRLIELSALDYVLGLTHTSQVLRGALRVSYVETAAEQFSTIAGSGKRNPTENQPAPEGSVFRNPSEKQPTPGGSAFRNPSENAMPAGSKPLVPFSGTPPVPFSGTAPSLLATSLTGVPSVQSKSNKVASLGPKGPGGTTGPAACEAVLPPCSLALNGLSSEQQRIFDALGSLGAFGPEDDSKGNWFDFVKKRAGVAERLISALRSRNARRNLKPVDSPGGWMNYEWQRWGKPNL